MRVRSIQARLAVPSHRACVPPMKHNEKTECPKGHPYAGDNLYITRKGYRMCKTCVYARVNATPLALRAERQKRYRAANPEASRESCRRWYAAHKEYNRMRNRVYKEINVDRLRQYVRDNRERYNRTTREWIKRNPEKAKLLWRRYAQRPSWIVRNRVCARLKRVLADAQTPKADTVNALVGCTARELVGHLESLFLSGMTWENRRLWHIDHKRPCASFDLTDPEQQKACFRYTNLQPLWAEDNLRKGAKLSMSI